MTPQIKRIRRMEQALNRSAAALASLSEALEKYEAVKSSLAALQEYYSGPIWRRDFEDDSKGLIPKELPRGVLSEDALYDLLTENDRLMQQLRALAKESPLPDRPG
ncbi:MAG: DUF4298 domain-containing protein [Provencibacterium sp.]|nr:DUF4298 domain-containing protein [Provencibacterium sp.]